MPVSLKQTEAIAIIFEKHGWARERMRSGGYGNQGLGIVTYIIITCVVLYVATSIPSNAALFNLLSFQPSEFLKQPWSLVTSMFLHAPFPNFTHILFNMLVLYFFGGFLLGLVGNTRFVLVYFIGGIAGNLLFWALAGPYSVVVGASGAIFAVEGALVVLRPKLPVFVFPIPAPIPLWLSVIGAFLLTYFAAGNVAWQAHLGGLAFGLLAGLYFKWRENPRRVF
jgi:uncharacterized protein